ncbi:MAG: prepilin-type N-terminal cleavage/methylation domain-containing protein [Nitrospirae bacterium]|nr:prepilin-type N-terminal cleavage/methylation domain-containing protein [Nitrospirota bacterium]
MPVYYDKINNCGSSIKQGMSPNSSRQGSNICVGIMANDKGFTLVEAIVSMLILIVVMLGMLQAIIISSSVAYKNELRDEAAKVASEEFEATRDVGFDNVLPIAGSGSSPCIKCTSANTFTRQFDNASINFTIAKTVANLDPNNKQVSITITWTFKSEPITYNINTLITRN